MEDVLKWLRENSKLPDFSFWEDRVLKGTLCSVSVSAYEQGYQAGMYAHDILLGRKSPAQLPVISSERGAALINMATAKRLRIEPSSDTLRLVNVIKDIALE
jgi:putative ABC transport system substrate-binding protein